jgi:hypothetical protein
MGDSDGRNCRAGGIVYIEAEINRVRRLVILCSSPA